jgi:DNA-binding response OmpR family regulator
MRILVVEDEVKLANSLQKVLVSEGYVADVAFDGETGFEMATVEPYDCILLDINLPGKDGLTLCREIRQEGVRAPVIMLTARDAVSDRVAGLDVGADDYLVKPFAIEELLARLRASLRRESADVSFEMTADTLTMNTQARVVTRNGAEVHVSAKEYALLEYLIRHKGEIVAKEVLLEHVWGNEVDPFSNVVDVYIGYLRKKIDKAFPKERPVLTTIKGMGYRIE